jgi:hypothetical protein
MIRPNSAVRPLFRRDPTKKGEIAAGRVPPELKQVAWEAMMNVADPVRM